MDRARVAGWEPYNLHHLAHASSCLFMYYADPAQPLTSASEELDDLYYLCDLEHELSVRGSI